jgi:hypothetical protein
MSIEVTNLSREGTSLPTTSGIDLGESEPHLERARSNGNLERAGSIGNLERARSIGNCIMLVLFVLAVPVLSFSRSKQQLPYSIKPDLIYVFDRSQFKLDDSYLVPAQSFPRWTRHHHLKAHKPLIINTERYL